MNQYKIKILLKFFFFPDSENSSKVDLEVKHFSLYYMFRCPCVRYINETYMKLCVSYAFFARFDDHEMIYGRRQNADKWCGHQYTSTLLSLITHAPPFSSTFLMYY